MAQSLQFINLNVWLVEAVDSVTVTVAMCH